MRIPCSGTWIAEHRQEPGDPRGLPIDRDSIPSAARYTMNENAPGRVGIAVAAPCVAKPRALSDLGGCVRGTEGGRWHLAGDESVPSLDRLESRFHKYAGPRGIGLRACRWIASVEIGMADVVADEVQGLSERI